MAHTQDSSEDWRDKFARIFKPAPPLASIYGIEYFADENCTSVSSCMTPTELWRSVFYHTVKRELETGDTQGRRYMHVDYLGLDVISVYEYPYARPTKEGSTAELTFGAMSAMSVEQFQQRLKAKLFYVPSYACTSFAIGHIMHDFLRSSNVTRPSLRKASVTNFSLTVDPLYPYMVFFRPCASTLDVSLPLSNRGTVSSELSDVVWSGHLNILQAVSGQATAPESCSSSVATAVNTCAIDDQATLLVPHKSVSLANPHGVDISAQDEERCAQEEQSKNTLGDASACEQTNPGASVSDLAQFDHDDDMDCSHDTSLSSVDSFGPSTPSTRDTFSRFSVINTGRRSLCNFHSVFSGPSGSPPRASLPRSDLIQSLDFSLLYGSTAWSGKKSMEASHKVKDKENAKRGFRTSAYSVPLPR